MRRQALLAGDAGYRDATPVFLVGMPRSGSTLVEQILASHSQAFGAGAAPGSLSHATAGCASGSTFCCRRDKCYAEPGHIPVHLNTSEVYRCKGAARRFATQ